MRIGILTWFFGMNYGAQAQTYALAHYLESEGHQCELIAYYIKHYRFKNMKMNLNIEKQWYKNPRQVFYSLRRIRRFKRFIGTHKLSPRIKEASSVDKQKYDLILIGSDELINCIHPFHESIYFGVGIKNTPIAYYAPSSGALQTDYVLGDNIRQSLSRFKALSGRDAHACEFLRNNTGKTVNQVVDPTLLYDFKDLMAPVPYKDYILIYSFDSMDAYSEKIKEYAKENNKKILALGRHCTWADQSYPYATENEWLSLFYYAHTVVTDSFHGLVFSIKYQKEFVLLGRSDKLNKNNDLLCELGINRGYLTAAQSISGYLKETSFNAAAVCETLERKIALSKDYLKKILESA